MPLGTIIEINFDTELPENHFLGDRKKNQELQSKYLGKTLDVETEYLEGLLDEIEDNCGWLVSKVVVQVAGSNEYVVEDHTFPILDGIYPKEWGYPNNYHRKRMVHLVPEHHKVAP